MPVKQRLFVRRKLRKAFGILVPTRLPPNFARTVPKSAALEAGRQFISRVDEAIDSGETIVVETTLSGKSFAKAMKKARARNYWIALQMVFVESPAESIMRVAGRVRRGGHHVPTNDVVRRFPRSLQNFWNIYRELADVWLLSYNESHKRRDVAELTNGEFRIYEEELFRKFFSLGEMEYDR